MLSAALVSVLLSSCSAEAPSKSPNILFLFSDDQRADAVGAYGNSVIRTPNLDRLSDIGFNFRQAYVMGSHHGAVCAPSRAMLLSGRGLYHVYDNLDSVATFPQLLRENGYVTFGTGKWHQSEEAFRKSFSAGSNIFFGGMSDHDRVPVRHMMSDGRFSDPEERGFSSTIFADAAINFIEGHAASGSPEPFLAYVSFTEPHDPRTPPAGYEALYPPADMPLPPNFKPVHPFHNGWMTGRDEQLAAWPRTPEVIRAQLSEYYGLISHLDAEIGRIIDAVVRNGFMDNTHIVFAADNGLAIGSHGLLGKQSLYQHSSQIPLIVAGPDIPKGSSEAYVYLYDLFPTLLSLAGTEVPSGIDGIDLSGIWRGEMPYVRETLFTTYEDIQRAVQDGRWKLIRYPKLHYNQLFDLENDPDELLNLADDPANREHIQRLMALLSTWQKLTDDPHPLTAEEQASMEFDYSVIERTPDRHQPEIIRQKYFQ